MEKTIEDHVRRVKSRLQAGRTVLAHLDLDLASSSSSEKNENATLPQPDDRFFVATDERDPAALRVITDAGAVFLAELLGMEERREFGWSLMLTDVRALVEQAVLAHTAYFYGHKMSSFAGRVANLRAARGADYRTTLLD
jgi:hypothetical protein